MIFLRKVREAWKTEFPFLKAVDLEETPKIPKGCNFRCDEYFGSRGVFYFFTFDFSPRRPGEFSIGVTVSPSNARSVLSPAVESNPTPTSIGSHSIAAFMGRQTFRWELVDVDAKTNAILTSLGGLPIVTPDYVLADTWKPSSFALPLEQIVDEAITDVNDKLRRFVFPKLAIRA
jgi:hypothetical protein